MSNIATFKSLRDEDDDDKPKDNQYYAGGHASGVAVQGGPGHGPASSLNAEQQGLFDQLRNSVAANANPEPIEQDVRSVTLTIWKGNLFSIDDGESEIVPRDPNTDPAAARLISEVQRGHVPSELRQKWGDNVDVNIENRHTEEFVAKKRPLKAFSGAGRRLGDVVPTVVGAATSRGAASTGASAPAATSSTAASAPDTNVDESMPVTKVQIRLADGTRLVARINTTQTVADLRHFVARAIPDDGREFVLMTTYPKKVLEDESATMEEAKLCGAAIIQKYI